MKAYLTMFILFICSSVYANDYMETRKMNLSASGIDMLVVECGPGSLDVIGKDGLDEIRVTAEIVIERVDDEDAQRIVEKYLEISLEERGDRVFLISEVRGKSSFFSSFFGGHRNIEINLTVEVPRPMDLRIDDGSGMVTIENTKGMLELDDGSGSVLIREASGDVEINDGSGSLEVREVDGFLDVVDGSGSMEITGVSGDVIIRDGSGSMTIERVDGNVEIRDGSGSISVSDVEKDLTIKEAGSGGVSISRVRGSVHRYDDDRW